MGVWAFLGAAGGAGFGLFAVPLIYILINLFGDGVTLGGTILVALGNGLTWGVLGLIGGVFLYILNRTMNPPAEE
jgi:hypothetical protein